MNTSWHGFVDICFSKGFIDIGVLPHSTVSTKTPKYLQPSHYLKVLQA